MEDSRKKEIMKIAARVAVILALIGIGFFAGRKTIKVPSGTPQVIYVPGDTVKVEIDKPTPVYVVKPIDTANVIANCIKSGKFKELFPTIVKDSIVYVDKTDSSVVIRDWATERFYEEKVFDIDTVGSAIIKAKTQYNRLTWMGTTFTPVTKETTVTNLIKKKYEPFIGFGVTTMPEIIINGGIYFDGKYGISALYEYDLNTKMKAVGMIATYKF